MLRFILICLAVFFGVLFVSTAIGMFIHSPKRRKKTAPVDKETK